MEFRGHQDIGFDPNTHINAVNEEYIKRKNAGGSKEKSFYKSLAGGCIVSATQGHRYPYKVGSVDEERFWTVMVNDGKESAKLFYDNPEQYEKHRKVIVDQKEKEAWHMKKEILRRKEVGLDTSDDMKVEDEN